MDNLSKNINFDVDPKQEEESENNELNEEIYEMYR
jgi:hypothetical protein